MQELTVDFLNRVCDTPIVAEERKPYGAVQSGFRSLRVWQAGMDLIESCYRVSQAFPKIEQFGLTSQLRRAAISITSNLAEGYGRHSQADFARFVDISVGSLCEVESLVEVSKRLEYVSSNEFAQMLERANKVGSMQFRLREVLKN